MRRFVLLSLLLALACSKDATGPTSVRVSLQVADTSYAHGAAILGVLAAAAQPGATLNLWASDGTLALTSAGHWSWTVDPQLTAHSVYGCAMTSGACTVATDTLKIGQLPHDPSMLVTSDVPAGPENRVTVRWVTGAGADDSVVLTTPIPAPGVCVRFVAAQGDSARWFISAVDSEPGAPSVTPSTLSWVWFGVDSLPAWSLQAQAQAHGSPLLYASYAAEPC